MMQHVDEGILNAMLDGALPELEQAGALPSGMSAASVIEHVAACERCSTLLEQERRAHTASAAVLRATLPSDAGLPPLPSLRPAGSPRAADTRSSRRWHVPVAWAASVLVAVGAGWIGSEVWRDTFMFSPGTTVTEREGPGTDATTPEEILDDARAAADEKPEQGAAPAADMAAPRSEQRNVLSPAVPVPAPPPTAAEAALPAEALTVTAAPAANTVAAAPPAPVLASPAAAGAAAGAAAEARSTDRVTLPQGGLALPDDAAAFSQTVVAARAGSLGAWVARDGEAATGVTLPGARVTRVEALDDGPGLLRVTQQTADGQVIQTISAGTGSARAQPFAQREQRSSASVLPVVLSSVTEADGHHVVARLADGTLVWVRVPDARDVSSVVPLLRRVR